MEKKYKGNFRIINYIISHKQLLIGSENSSIYFMFKGVAEINIIDNLYDPKIELIEINDFKQSFSHHEAKVDFNYLKYYKISQSNFLGHILAYSFQAYRTIGFLPLSIDDFIKRDLELLDDF